MSPKDFRQYQKVRARFMCLQVGIQKRDWSAITDFQQNAAHDVEFLLSLVDQYSTVLMPKEIRRRKRKAK